MALEQVSIFDVITPALLKNTTLLGVDLTLDDGSPYPDDQFDQAIRAAVGLIERDLGIVIDPFSVEGERHDAISELRSNWWPFDVDYRPLRSITEFRIQYGNFQSNTIPVSWLKVTSSMFGQFSVVPGPDAVSGYVMSTGVPFLSTSALFPLGYLPAYFEFDYEAGFLVMAGTVEIPAGESEVTVEIPELQHDPYELKATIATASGAAGLRVKRRSSTSFTLGVSTPPSGAPAVVDVVLNAMGSELVQAVLLTAAMMPLDIAGDLIAGAGIASISTSMDGLSQNINTTSSATNSGYGARVIQFRNELKALMSALRAKFKKMNMISM